MTTAVSGSVTVFFLYDVAEAIDLATVRGMVSATASVQIAPKTQSPPYVQYAHPPISIDGQAVGIPDVGGFQVRFRLFDYGVISLALTRAKSSK